MGKQKAPSGFPKGAGDSSQIRTYKRPEPQAGRHFLDCFQQEW